MNKVIMTGNLKANADYKEFGENKSVSNFTLAVKKPGSSDKVVFVKFVAWNKMAEIAGEYLKKGRKVLVEGWYNVRVNKTKNQTYYNTEIVVDRIEFLDDQIKGRKNMDDWPEGIPEEFKNAEGLVGVEEGEYDAM